MASNEAASGGEDVFYHVYGKEGPDLALAGEALRHASASTRFRDIEPGVSVREGMNQRNWEFFRPGEALPRRKNEIVVAADNVYRYNGIVKFVIDMMADFVTQGIEIHHPAASKQKRYRHWWKKVGGQQVSERLVNHLYRHGSAIVKRNFGVLNAGDLDDLERGVAATFPDDDDAGDKRDVEKDIPYDRAPRAKRNRIPLKYTFLNPTTVEVIGGELAIFAGQETRYGLKIPDALYKTLKAPKSAAERLIIANLPSYVTNIVGAGKKLIPLDPEKVTVLHYKKDDWMLWADPLCLSIFDDLVLYKKMKDSDKAALDGAIRSIRLWKLGLPEHKIQPGPGAFKRLRDQLLANAGGGSMDLIWDAALDLKETSTDVYKFLGSQKYEPVLQAIFAGLGVPQSLTGGAGEKGLGNNVVSLKTLLERLQYARNVLVSFWEREFYLLQRAFGDRQPARLRFQLMSLSDEAAERKFWMDLFDRDAISLTSLQETVGLLPDVERARTVREYQMRDAEKLAPKTGPFQEAAPHPDQMVKAAMQSGQIAPSEAGVKTKPRKKGDRSMLDRQDDMQQKQLDLQKDQMAHEQQMQERELEVKEKQGDDLHRQKLQQNDDLHQQKMQQRDVEHKAMLPIKKKEQVERSKVRIKQAKQKGQPGQGRPLGVKDSTKRKARPAISSFLGAQVAGRRLLRSVADAVTPLHLVALAKRNLRGLSTAQADEFEALKFRILCSFPPGETPSAADLAAAYEDPPAPGAEGPLLASLVAEAYDVPPTAEELRELQVYAYATIHSAGNEGEADGEADGDR